MKTKNEQRTRTHEQNGRSEKNAKSEQNEMFFAALELGQSVREASTKVGISIPTGYLWIKKGRPLLAYKTPAMQLIASLKLEIKKSQDRAHKLTEVVSAIETL